MHDSDQEATATRPPDSPEEGESAAVRIERIAAEAFGRFVSGRPGFIPRQGQQRMAQEVARVFAHAELGGSRQPKEGEDGGGETAQPIITAIQAGTGVGKSVGYSVPAIIAALERKTCVIISTGTVALQEQLVHKDLPAIAEALDRPFKFALAKGRGRYVCTTKLRRLGAQEGQTPPSLFDDMDEVDLDGGAGEEGARPAPQTTREDSVRLYRQLKQDLDSGRWDGERDSLDNQPDAGEWGAVAADRHTCTARKCPDFAGCAYFKARRTLVESDVIVVNHDLLLSSLGTRLLPDLGECLLVLDEGHNLPEVAADQFTAELDLTRTGWIDQLAKRMRVASRELNRADLSERLEPALRGLKVQLKDLQRMARDLFDPAAGALEQTRTFDRGVLPVALLEPIGQVQTLANAAAVVMREASAEISDRLKDPDAPALMSELYAGLGAFSPRVSAAVNASERLLATADDPHAKWATMGDAGGYLHMTLHASPLNADENNLLARYFWPQVRAAVVTSATLKSCGSFEFFLQESGLRFVPGVSTLEVQSPFDYPKQGKLVVVRTEAAPRDQERYERETIGELLLDLAEVESGALVLFTSRRHMQQAVRGLPDDLRHRVLVQGDLSRQRLLGKHRDLVDQGRPSIIFGLQSFGEGLDLPGRYCETLIIAKLPFSPPTDPIASARSRWLEDQRRSAFEELVVPQAGMRMAQWIGRAIRTENDQASVICYDARLLDTQYGRTILQGLPRFARYERQAGITQPI